MSNLQRIVYLSEIEFATLLSEGTITKGGRTLVYNPNDLYITPENTDENTTYTFESGTNSFTVTPSDGESQVITVTPNIPNNITGSGTNNYLAKFNGANTITAGPQLGSSTTTFLNNSGTWTTPTDTTYVFDGTYNATTNKAATVSTVTNAIAALDGVLTGSPAASKTLTAFSQTDGTITATFSNISIEESQVTNLTTHLNEKASLASPNFSGIPTAPTAAVGTSTTQIATTAFVQNEGYTKNTGTVTSITLTAGAGISINDSSAITTSGSRTITNSGVRAITTGSTDGTIAVNTNGTTSQIVVKGLGTAAYTASTAYATAAQGTKADNAMPKSGGTFTGAVTLAANPTTNLEAATKQYVDNRVSVSGTLGSGTQLGIITVGGTDYTIYAPNSSPSTIEITQSSTSPTAEFITSTNTSSSSELTGVLPRTTTISDGQIIYYMTAYATPESNITMKLRYSDTSNYTASIPIYVYGDIRCTTAYPAGYILTLIYYNSRFYIIANNLAIVQ